MSYISYIYKQGSVWVYLYRNLYLNYTLINSNILPVLSYMHMHL